MTAPAVPAPTSAAPSTASAPASSPLAAAIAAAGDALDARQAAQQAPTPEPPTTTPGDTPASAEAPDATPPDTATPETTETTPDAAAEPTLYDVDLPLPNADGAKGPRGTGALKMQFESQEAADTMRHWVKQGLKAKELEQQVGQLEETRAALALAKEQPDTFLHMVTANRPEAAQSFVQQWMQANPDAAIGLFGSLGFGEKSEEVLRLEGKLAAKEAAERVRAGTQTVTERQVNERFASRADATVRDLASQIGLAPNSAAARAFESACADVIVQHIQQNPAFRVNGDVSLILQDQVREFQEFQQARQAKVVRATAAPRDAAGKFAEQAAKAQKLRQQAPGATTLTPLSIEKVTGTNDVMDIIKALKH